MKFEKLELDKFQNNLFVQKSSVVGGITTYVLSFRKDQIERRGGLPSDTNLEDDPDID